MTQLGFTCRDLSQVAQVAASERTLSPLQKASAMLGTATPA
jgi:hypothetical protein